MGFIVSIIKGIALGAGAILPGISSGVLCVVFGLYDKLINSILDFFKDIKGNSKFLFPIILGIGIGVIVFGNFLRMLFTYFPIQTKFAFIGLILGSIPILFKTANAKNGFRLHYIIYTIFTFLLAVLLLSIEKNFTNNNLLGNTSFIYLVMSGFIMSIGVVVPGVSSSVLLMILGIYDLYLISISTLNIFILIPMGIGLAVGGIIFLKIIKYFLDNYFTKTYYSIIGFVLGSIIILYPGIHFDISSFIGIIFCVFCFFIAYIFEKNDR